MIHLSNCGVTPLDLIAGLKHSGKTSLINALLRGPYRDRTVTVFTNALGNTDYAENARVHTVLGGCICCTAQAALIAEIRNALRLEAPDHLIVELSGQGTHSGFTFHPFFPAGLPNSPADLRSERS